MFSIVILLTYGLFDSMYNKYPASDVRWKYRDLCTYTESPGMNKAELSKALPFILYRDVNWMCRHLYRKYRDEQQNYRSFPNKRSGRLIGK